MAKSVANGDFYERIGAVALLTAESDDDGNYFLKTEDFKNCAYYNGLNFRFRVEYKADGLKGVIGNGSVSILGLGVDTIKKWTAIDIAENNRAKLQYIRVYAGYKSDGSVAKCELFTVRCVGAVPTMPPDMWLNFTVWEGTAGISDKVLATQGLFLAGDFVPGEHEGGAKSSFSTKKTYRSTSGISIKDACRKLAEAVANQYGYKTNPDAKDEEGKFLHWYISPELEKRLPKLRAVDFSCETPEEAVETINSWGLVRAYFQEFEEDAPVDLGFTDYVTALGEGLVKGAAIGLFGDLKGVEEGKYDVVETSRRMWHPILVVKPNFGEWKYDTTVKAPFEISQDTGMIGLPWVAEKNGANQVVVKCLIRRDIGIGDLIKISSKYVKLPYEYYQVNKVVYDGEFRGQNWYVTYTAVSAKSEEEKAEEAEKKQRQEDNAKKAAADQKTKQKEDAISWNMAKSGRFF